MKITDKDLQQFRERAKTELQSNGTVGRLAWDTVVNALCNEVKKLRAMLDANIARVRHLEGMLGNAADAMLGCAIKQKESAPGNAAAMRAAIVNVASFAANAIDYDGPERDVDAYRWLGRIAQTASAALAAPARNCDRYATYAEAVEAYREWTRRTTGDVSNVSGRGMLGWLFAPAEGGDHA